MAQGLAFCVKESADLHEIELEDRDFIVQGFGNVGSNVALILSEMGMSFVGVGDHSCYMRSSPGSSTFDVHALKRYAEKNGGALKGFGQCFGNLIQVFCRIVTRIEFDSAFCPAQRETLEGTFDGHPIGQSFTFI